MADLTLTSGHSPQGDAGGGRDGRTPGPGGNGPATASGDGRESVSAPTSTTPPTNAPAVAPAPSVDPRAVRARPGLASRSGSDEPVVLAPIPAPLEPPRDSLAGRGLLGGQAPLPSDGGRPTPAPDEVSVLDASPAAGPTVLVDGQPIALRLVDRGPDRATLVEGEGMDARRARLVLGPSTVGVDGVVRREIVVDGWRIDVELESERRAALRERAHRGRETAARGGPTEVRAIIPGRVVAVSVAPGDALTAGQQILVVEAMKMQNELRAPRDGTVQKVGVAPGENIEVGDLLLVIE